MKFIDKEGNISEGVPLTEKEEKTREALVDEMHRRICGFGVLHRAYDRKYNGAPKCETISNYLIQTFLLEVKEGFAITTDFGQPEASKSEVA